MNKEYKIFKSDLAKAKTEEHIKNAYAEHFKINFDTSDMHNLYTSQVLFMFNYDENMLNQRARATVLGQILYHVHKLKFGFTQKAIPVFLCLSGKNETIITETILWKNYYSDIESYDWNLNPNIPDKQLVDKLIDDGEFKNLHIYNLENEKDYNVFSKKIIHYSNQQQKIERSILSKTDTFSNEEKRRFHGEFYTPIRFANKALEYIEHTIGKEWWKSGEYRVWDMAAGTGNLEYSLPSDSYQYLYLSTLHPTEVEHCEKHFPSATVFQYDYLNDDVGNVFLENNIGFEIAWKLPEKLRKDLSNPQLKWIILINPPFATSQTAGKNSKSKSDVSNTEIRKIMHQHNLGEVSRELFAQFIFRIKKEFENKDVYFGLFSKIKYLNSNNDQKFRDLVFQFEYIRGFIFSSLTFSGTKGNFPVGFLIWNLAKIKKIQEQNIIVDIINDKVEKIGCKTICSENRNNFLSKWIKRPPVKIKFPPLGSAINFKFNNKDKRDRISQKFLASFMCAGNDFQSQNQTAFASAPFVSAGALSVTPENFEKSMVVHAVRRIPKATWINDRDQFLIPQQELSQEFIGDCAIWNLFSNSNQTAAMKDVEYEDETYQIENHFFPILVSELKTWTITDSDILLSLASVIDRFVAKWISEHKLSEEAKAVYEAGKEIYKFYFTNLNRLNTHLAEIKTWDAGFWQIKKVLHDRNLVHNLFKTLKEKHNILRDKLLPQIYDYEFIPKIEI